MDVDAAAGRDAQHVARQDLPVCRDDEQVRRKCLEAGDAFRRVDALRLENGYVVLVRDRFHAAACLPG